jgi:hypothetical protein
MDDTDKQGYERRAETVREDSRQLYADAWLWELARRMPGANRLTVAVTALVLARHNLFP